MAKAMSNLRKLVSVSLPAVPYWRFNGAPTPTFQSGVVNSYDPYFRAGGAGTALFLVAGFGKLPG